MTEYKIVEEIRVHQEAILQAVMNLAQDSVDDGETIDFLRARRDIAMSHLRVALAQCVSSDDPIIPIIAGHIGDALLELIADLQR